MNKAARVEAAKPPITARPNGADCSPASPIPDAIGIIPAIIAKLVINIGLSLMEALVTAARVEFLNSKRKLSPLVTINIALATDTPVDMIIPMYDCRLSVDPVINNAVIDPNITAGMVTKTVSDNLND